MVNSVVYISFYVNFTGHLVMFAYQSFIVVGIGNLSENLLQTMIKANIVEVEKKKHVSDLQNLYGVWLVSFGFLLVAYVTFPASIAAINM